MLLKVLEVRRFYFIIYLFKEDRSKDTWYITNMYHIMLDKPNNICHT